MSNNKLEILWSRLKHNHLLLMALCCLVPVGLVAGWLYLFKGSEGSWVWLILLLCPLMHVWMMRNNDERGSEKK